MGSPLYREVPDRRYEGGQEFFLWGAMPKESLTFRFSVYVFKTRTNMYLAEITQILRRIYCIFLAQTLDKRG